MSMIRLNSRKTGLAGLLALLLLLGSLTVVGSSAQAGEPMAVFYGYVVPAPGMPLPKRVRAVSEDGVVCGSAYVVATASPTAGVYAMSVVADGVKAGCPVNGGGIRFSLVYGLIDEDVIVGQSTYQSGAVIELHLLHLWDLTERTR